MILESKPFVNLKNMTSMINPTVGSVTKSGATVTFTSLKLVNIPGDAHGDGNVNAIDITKVERIIVSMDVPTPDADTNQDGSINALDITKLERINIGLD